MATQAIVCKENKSMRIIVRTNTFVVAQECLFTTLGPVTDPGFSSRRGGTNPSVWGKNLLFVWIFVTICMKMKEIGPRARIPGAPLD